MRLESPSPETMMRLFPDPPPEYGLYPNWWWEGGVVTKEKLTRQAEQMKKAGSHATFFYLRYVGDEPFAIVPAYGSDEFYDLFRHTLEDHRRLGMEFYFSEWTGQRSVTEELARDPQAHAALAGGRLVLRERLLAGGESAEIELPPGEELLSAAAYRVVPGGLDESTRLDLAGSIDGTRLRWAAPDGEWRTTVVTARRHGLDWLNPATADRWLESIWGPYLERMPEFIGNTLKGYVQDELDVLDGDLIYSPILLERFRERKGYDPRPRLAALFYDVGPSTEKVRCDYYGVMSDLLEENLYRRMFRWHEDRNMRYGTVAIRGRQDILAETNHFGDLFKLMRWYHFPGNEDPQVEGPIPRRRRFIDAKLSSSAAHIFERQRTALCCYWGSGWGATMEQHLAWTNENYAYGMNLYDPHGVIYGLAGGFYEWVPPTNYFFQPYSEHFGAFSDYVRRLSYVLSQGVHRADVALLFPTTAIHAGWLRGHRFTLDADVAASTTYNMADSLYGGGVDFDFIDDDTVCRAEVRGGALCVAGLEFRAVALPPMAAVRNDTLRKLRELYEGGGVVLAYGRLPSASAENGRGDPELRGLLQDIFGIPSSDGYEHPTSMPEGEHEDHFSSSVLVRRSAAGGTAMFVPGEQNSGTNASAIDLPAVISSVVPRDVSAPWGAKGSSVAPGIYHTHQRVDGADVYFLHNAIPEARSVTLDLRAVGEPQVWDALTGRVTPLHRFERLGDTTRVRLRMEPHQGVLLSLSPSTEATPAVVEDDLAGITSVEEVADGLVVRGTTESPGRRSVRVRHRGREYTAGARIAAPPEPMPLGGEWDFSLKPTMDNRWGDFRHPASPVTLGAEARRFRYAEESGRAGWELGWHEAGFDDGSWSEHTYSYGPYWYSIGPFPNGREPSGLEAELVSGQPDLGRQYEVEGRTLHWQRYQYSELFGNESPEAHGGFGGLEGVSDCFLAFSERSSNEDASHYLVTTVTAEQEGAWDLVFGGGEDFPRRAWVNGSQVMSAGDAGPREPKVQDLELPWFQQGPPPVASGHPAEVRVRVRLNQGHNTVLLKVVQPDGRRVRSYAVFLPGGADPTAGRPPVPRLRWFIEPTGLTYDVRPDSNSVGWYRFDAPAGMRAMALPIDALGVRAWVDGHEVEVRDGRVEVERPRAGVSSVALRVEHRPGRYAGAAFREPVSIECGPARLPLGDWSDHGLESYSGGAVYGRDFDLEPRHLKGRVVLDLGRVHTTAEVVVNGESAGVCFARPNLLDVTGLVRDGRNRIEVTVYNTLANHYSQGIPSRFVFEGQTVSGLVGPVTLRFPAEITLLARTPSP